MRVFIIVNRVKNIQEKISKIGPCKKHLQTIFIACLMIIGAGLYCSFSMGENAVLPSPVEDNEQINIEAGHKSKILFPIEEKNAPLKNPFSLDHELKPILPATTVEQDKIALNHKVADNMQVAQVVAKTVDKQNNQESFERYVLKAILHTNGNYLILLEKNQKGYYLTENTWVDNMKLVKIKEQAVVLELKTGQVIECKLNQECKVGA